MKLPQGAGVGIGYAVAIVVGVGAIYWLGKKLVGNVVEVAKDVGTAINPISHENLANRAVTAVGESISGDKNWTLGGWIYDVTHEEYE